MATSSINVTPGTGKVVATNSITEDSATKELQRVVLNNSSGTELGNSTTPVQVSLANTAANATAVKTDGSAVTQPVSAASLPLPSGASTAAKQPALGTAGTPSADVISIQGVASMTAVKVDGSAVTQPVSGTFWQATQPISAASLPLPTSASTEATLGTRLSESDFDTKVGSLTETAPTTDTASSGLNGRLQRIAQRITSLIALIPTALTGSGNFKVAVVESTATQTVNVSGTPQIIGSVAHDGVDADGPVKIGGQARQTNPTAVADADRVNAIFDDTGKQVVVGSIRDLKVTQKTTITSSTSETTIGTAVASTFLDLYGLMIANTSATACNVTIKDSTAGTTRFIIAVPAGDTRGFMLPESGGHNQATVNNNWTATCSASVASIEITALFVKNI